MNVTRDIVVDLIAVYQTGEASDDTKRAVEDLAARDPEIAAILRDEREALPAIPEAKPDAELRTLRRTRSAVAWRSLVLAGAIFFSLAPASVRSSDDGPLWLAMTHPQWALGYGAVALVLWAIWFALRRRLRVIGL